MGLLVDMGQGYNSGARSETRVAAAVENTPPRVSVSAMPSGSAQEKPVAHAPKVAMPPKVARSKPHAGVKAKAALKPRGSVGDIGGWKGVAPPRALAIEPRRVIEPRRDSATRVASASATRVTKFAHRSATARPRRQRRIAADVDELDGDNCLEKGLKDAFTWARNKDEKAVLRVVINDEVLSFTGGGKGIAAGQVIHSSLNKRLDACLWLGDSAEDSPAVTDTLQKDDAYFKCIKTIGVRSECIRAAAAGGKQQYKAWALGLAVAAHAAVIAAGLDSDEGRRESEDLRRDICRSGIDRRGFDELVKHLRKTKKRRHSRPHEDEQKGKRRRRGGQ